MTTNLHCFQAYFAIWNTRDEETMRSLVRQALTPDVVFCDPNHDIQGHDAFISMVLEFLKRHKGCEVLRTSAVDQHHDRARYSWAILGPDGRRFDGLDAVQLDLASGKMARIDGFFGSLPPA